MRKWVGVLEQQIESKRFPELNAPTILRCIAEIKKLDDITKLLLAIMWEIKNVECPYCSCEKKARYAITQFEKKSLTP